MSSMRRGAAVLFVGLGYILAAGAKPDAANFASSTLLDGGQKPRDRSDAARSRRLPFINEKGSNMKKSALMLLAILMTGCASTSYKGLPDGRANLDCSGMMRGWRSCEKRAAELCSDSGYNILSTTAEKGPKDPGWSERLMAEYNAPRSMVIACKSGHLE